MIRNPSVGDEILIGLFRREGPFEKIPEERWRTLVGLSGDNRRLWRDRDDDYGPDMGFWSIQRAIRHLLMIAPVSPKWCRAIAPLLSRVHPPSVVNDEPIGPVLDRWSSLDIRDSKGEEDEGWYSRLSMADEFRCLIAAAYGTGFKDGKRVHAGAPSSATLPERCAYYAGASLKPQHIKEFSKRDKAGFGLAFMFNEVGLIEKDTRAAFEEHASYDQQLYRARLQALAESRPFLAAVVARIDAEHSPPGATPGTLNLSALQTQIAALQKQQKRAGYVFFLALILIIYLLCR